MKRTAMVQLERWKESEDRKPLIIQGVRQVGKTWLMKHFADTHFANRHHYLNFDDNPALCELFQSSRTPDVILEALAHRSPRPVEKGDLLIFDEVQACPDAIHALKYFCELRPDLYILTAGSLLGVQLARPKSFPVGKVDFMTLDPLSFTEFLIAQNEEHLVNYMRSRTTFDPLPELFTEPLIAKYRHYLSVGGMPEAASAWCLHQNMSSTRAAQKRILEAYALDVQSHADAIDIPKITRIWKSVPAQLSRENNQFRYSVVEERTNARKYGDALRWLIDARMLRVLHRLNGVGLPLSAYEDPAAFKIYLVDVGLLTNHAGLTPEVIADDENKWFREMKGSLTENFVLQSLSPQFEQVAYWALTKPQAEVDFVVQVGGHVVPIEVKASTNVRSPSLQTFKMHFGDRIPLRVRLSLRNLSLDGDLLNIPLYMADETRRLIELALTEVT